MPTFATPAPISATIDVIAGDIRIIASDRADTVVEVRPRDTSKDLDVKTADQTRVDFADGRLTVKSPKPLQVYFSSKSATVDVTVQLPAGSHVRGTTAQGDVYAEGRLGDCHFRTYDGDIGLYETGSLTATTLDGRITADRVAGDAHITGSGDVQLTEVTGAASVKNLNGPSWIGQAGGDVRVNSAHGDVVIDRAGPQVVARTAHGSVRLGEVARGTANLQTASGEIEIGIRHGTAAWLDVKSSSGTVRNELESGGSPEGPEETAQIRARTWDGDIVIRRAA
jgi:DUF4097 and DUF4098 domain-containing protein YvlB